MSQESRGITSIVSMQLRTMPYYIILCNTEIQKITLQYDEMSHSLMTSLSKTNFVVAETVTLIVLGAIDNAQRHAYNNNNNKVIALNENIFPSQTFPSLLLLIAE